MRIFSIGAVMFFLVSLAVPALSAEDNHFRLGVGIGVPHGGIGVNAEYRINTYASVGAGLGYYQYDGPGWALGAMFYPLENIKTFNPRLIGYFGRVGTVNWSDGRHEGYLGGAIGGGFEWRMYKKISLDLDMFYLAKDLPAGIKSNTEIGYSAGIGFLF
ncbi:MAG: hypothetical protein HY888_14280 [Deltaproteobacteria bacterium]|nr:hypothetical protein [Deltaproteobacteria bacterium]